MKRKEVLIIFVLALLVAGLTASLPNILVPYGEYSRFGFPLPFFKMYNAPWEEAPTEVYILSNLVLDLVFWFLVLAAGWWVVRKVKK